MAKLNENKNYQNYDPMVTEPWWLAEEVSANECNNLQNGHGTSGADETNCDVFQNDLIPALIQEYRAIQRGDIVIAANEDSKCSDGSPLPTLASILSRILRFSQAVACVLCTYDPILINILKSGEYPQILMGQSGSKYPIWRTPSVEPTPGSKLPITSGGVWEAIQQAIMSVFHEATDDREWVANGGKLTYDFFTKDPSGLDKICEGYWDEDEDGGEEEVEPTPDLEITFTSPQAQYLATSPTPATGLTNAVFIETPATVKRNSSDNVWVSLFATDTATFNTKKAANSWFGWKYLAIPGCAGEVAIHDYAAIATEYGATVESGPSTRWYSFTNASSSNYGCQNSASGATKYNTMDKMETIQIQMESGLILGFYLPVGAYQAGKEFKVKLYNISGKGYTSGQYIELEQGEDGTWTNGVSTSGSSSATGEAPLMAFYREDQFEPYVDYSAGHYIGNNGAKCSGRLGGANRTSQPYSVYFFPIATSKHYPFQTSNTEQTLTTDIEVAQYMASRRERSIQLINDLPHGTTWWHTAAMIDLYANGDADYGAGDMVQLNGWTTAANDVLAYRQDLCDALNALEGEMLVGVYLGSDPDDWEAWDKDPTPVAFYKVPLGLIASGELFTVEIDPSLETYNADNPQFSTLRKRDDGVWTNIPEKVPETPDPNDGPCPAEGNTALVQNGANGLNQEYLYEDGVWVPMDVMKAPSNYAVIHINRGMYRDEELYWLDINGVQSWNQMDVSDASIRKRLAALEEIYAQAVLPVNPELQYMLTTAKTLSDAKAVPCTEGKDTIVLITG